MSESNLKAGWKAWRFEQMAFEVKDRIGRPVDSGLERYVGLGHLDTGSLKIWRWGSTSDVEKQKLLFKKGDIIFGRRNAYLRRIAVADFEGVCSAHAMVLRAHEDVVLSEFLPFFMQTDRFWETALKVSAGSMSPTINWRNIAKEEFFLPPLEEQRRIVRILSAIEEYLTLLADAHEKTTTLWRSISAKEFNDIAKAELEELDTHYSIVSGQVDPKVEQYADLPLIAPNHIEQRTGVLLDMETAREQNAISGKYLFSSGAVIYSKIRPNLVKVIIAPCKGLCSADMYPLVPSPTIRKEYLLEILLSDKFTQFAVSGSMRTGMPKLNRDFLSRYRCKVPGLKEQDQYLEIALAARSAREEISNRITRTDEIKSDILQEVLSE